MASAPYGVNEKCCVGKTGAQLFLGNTGLTVRSGALRGLAPVEGVAEEGTKPPKRFARRGFVPSGARGRLPPFYEYRMSYGAMRRKYGYEFGFVACGGGGLCGAGRPV
jgi:hypothetical protein